MDLSWIEGALGWIAFLPLLGFTWNILLGKKLPHRLVHSVGVGSIGLSFLLSLAAFQHLRGLEPHARVVTQSLWKWLDVGGGGLPLLDIDVALTLDPLSSVMLLVVSGVGFLIHVYSIGYMRGDTGYWRFFAYLNLFSFAMLMLVLSDNLLLMFVGWEGVGLCSYLLIGFWFRHLPNTTAGNKAFIVNRIGDFGFLVGMLLLFWGLFKAGYATLRFSEINDFAYLLAGQKAMGLPLLDVIGVCLFVGATGKSAQIPLYVWLPDAMAGPTPVSALIHAATMVTAGVYMMARLSGLYVMAPGALVVVATVGALTALFAATIGLAQNDIKKVLAYSTVSQLGYMVLAIGTAAFSAGIFHLMTHAFFKACLFLGSGSVILSMHHEQDMRKMGGLAKVMPVTFWTFLISTIAIAGIPPFAGFFSKDEILWKAWEMGAQQPWFRFLWLLGLLAAALTAFYMFRLVSMTFFGKNRADEHTRAHLKEQPAVVTVPLVFLAIGAMLSGLVGVPHALGGSNRIHQWLAPVMATAPAATETQHASGSGLFPFPADARAEEEGGHGEAKEEQDTAVTGHRQPGDDEEMAAVHEAAAEGGEHGEALGHAEADSHGAHPVDPVEYLLMILSVLVAATSGAAAIWIYTRRPDLPARWAEKASGLYRLLYNKYFVDEFYDASVIRGVLALMRFLKRFDELVIDGIVNGSAFLTKGVAFFGGWLDNRFVDGMVNGTATTARLAGDRIRRMQTGRIQSYAYAVVTGIVILVLVVLLMGFPR